MSEAAAATMSFDAVLRREHFAEFSLATQRRLGHFGLRNWIGLAYLVVVFVLTLFFLRFADQMAIPLDPSSLLGPGEVAVLALVSGLLLTFLLTAVMARSLQSTYIARALRDGGSYLGARRFTLDETGIAGAGVHGRWLTYWSTIEEMTEAGATLMLWTDPGAAIMVPKDAFATPEALERFKAFVAARIAASRTA